MFTKKVTVKKWITTSHWRPPELMALKNSSKRSLIHTHTLKCTCARYIEKEGDCEKQRTTSFPWPSELFNFLEIVSRAECSTEMTKFSILIVVTKFYDFKPTLGLVIWLMGLCTDEILGFFLTETIHIDQW